MSARAKLKRLRRRVRELEANAPRVEMMIENRIARLCQRLSLDKLPSLYEDMATLRRAWLGELQKRMVIEQRLDNLEAEVMVLNAPFPSAQEPTPPKAKREPCPWEVEANLGYERGRIFATKDVASAVVPEEPHLAYLLGFNEAMIEQEARRAEEAP
jgi:hypothetical protein